MRRKRAPGAGNARELLAMGLLESEGWLVSSRRHWPGPGDVLAVRAALVTYSTGNPRGHVLEARLIEVKSTAGGPWERFGPQDREALRVAAEEAGAEPWLYWWPPRRPLSMIPATDWPSSRIPGRGTNAQSQRSVA
jgi:hypothetical protein